MGDTCDGTLRPQFGNRHLVDKARVFDHNAWDNVVWDDDLKDDAEQKIKVNSAEIMNKDKQDEYEKNASLYWNDFYCVHDNKFFKDRHWLFTEFSELAPKGALSEPQTKLTDDTDVGAHGDTSKSGAEKGVLFKKLDDLTVTSPSIYPGANAGFKILEAGCGVGNTVFPILQVNNNPDLFIYCCDFAKSAIDIVKEHELYDPSRCYAFPCDISDEDEVFPFPENSLDVIVLIFVLSAIQPSRMQPTVKRLCQYLKPGGLLLFRDYGRYDMAQLRFKKGRCLSDNFYVRGDGTRVYFFTQDELDQMLTECGLIKEQNHIDRRLQINRGKQLKMYRVWIQCKYKKPVL